MDKNVTKKQYFYIKFVKYFNEVLYDTAHAHGPWTRSVFTGHKINTHAVNTGVKFGRPCLP